MNVQIALQIVLYSNIQLYHNMDAVINKRHAFSGLSSLNSPTLGIICSDLDLCGSAFNILIKLCSSGFL